MARGLQYPLPMDIKDTATETLVEIAAAATSEAVKATVARELRRRTATPPAFYPELIEKG